MSDSPPTTTEEVEAPEPELSIEQQIDKLLVQIEEAEPGTIDPEVLPSEYRQQQEEEAQAAAEAASPGDELSPLQEAIQEEAAAPAEQTAATPETEAPTDGTGEQPDMMAALSSALQGLGQSPESTEAGGTQSPEPTAQVPADEPSSEQQLQDEINALLQSPPEASAPPAETPEPAEPATAAELSEEDQIAQEIEGLLNAEAQPPADTPPAKDDPSIDDLDQMLAEEIDADDELAGDFQSVQDITGGIQTDEPEPAPAEDVHAATASDVAAELDSQPEDQPTPAPAAAPTYADAGADDDDPLAMLSQLAETAEKNEVVYQKQQGSLLNRLNLPLWVDRFYLAKDRLLRACFVINWPARRFLTSESRANLGYIALLNLFGAAAVWIYLIVL